MKYIVNKPLKFIDQFDFYKDDTPWEGEYKKEIKINKKGEKGFIITQIIKMNLEKNVCLPIKSILILKMNVLKTNFRVVFIFYSFVTLICIMLELLPVILKIDYLNTL